MVKAKTSKGKSSQNLPKPKEEPLENTIAPLDQSSVHIGDFDIEVLIEPAIKHLNEISAEGLSLLILTNNREKAIKLKGKVKELTKNTSLATQMLIKGNNPSIEMAKLENPGQIFIATGKKILFHIENASRKLNFQGLKYVFIDDFGSFAENPSVIGEIYEKIPSQAVTKVANHDKSQGLSDFISKFLGNCQVYEKKMQFSMPNAIQKYVKVEPEDKFLLLYTFLFRNKARKTIVFLQSSLQAKYYKKILKILDITVYAAHSLKSEAKIRSSWTSFIENSSGILILTFETMKLLEKTPCDTIILYDFADFSWYLRFMSEKVHDGTKAIWFTDNNEEAKLKAKGLVMEKMTFEKNKMINVQGRIEKMVQKNYAVHRAAREAYRDYILSVVEKDCHKVAKSFGLDRAPLVNGLRD